jgi:hypothetical protein
MPVPKERPGEGPIKPILEEASKPIDFEKPVTWLLGSQVLRQVGWIALYTAFGRRLGGIDWMAPTILREKVPAGTEELWFDYLADSGDSQKATYSVAYLCMSDLSTTRAETGACLSFTGTDTGTGEGKGPDGADGASLAGGDRPVVTLPRGQFLFVGGDTAYHVSNVRTIRQRFRNPFYWASKDLEARGRAAVKREGRIYAIPGNHDYYDSLGGFNHQFRRPIGDTHPLDIPGFKRTQQASYVAIALPFGWWFLGLDTQEGEMDRRQRAFFQRVLAGVTDRSVPRKLIVATPEPTTVFGRRCSKDASIVEAQTKIGLETPYLEENPQLEKALCRLDLSGDVHHYTRYWGDAKSPHYASVVSGLGGAFLHPSHTRLGDLVPAQTYPSPEISRIEVNRRLLNPWRIFSGGNVPVLGFLLGLMLTFAWRREGPREFLGRSMQGVLLLSRGHAPTAWQSPLSTGAISFLLGLTSTVAAVILLRRYAKAIPDRDADLRRPVFAYIMLGLVAFASAMERLIEIAEGLSPWAQVNLHMEARPSPLTGSVMLFFFLLFGLAAIGASVWHREMLDERAKKRRDVRWGDDLLSLYIAVCGFVTIGGGLWTHGEKPARMLVLHLAFIAVGLVSTVGLVAIAVKGGAAGRSPRVKLGFGLLGAFHGALQFGIPLLWARQGASAWMLGHLALVPAVNVLGYLAATRGDPRRTRWLLVLSFLVAGAVNLALPIAVALARGDSLTTATPIDDFGLLLANGFAVALMAGALGCTWAGWYFATSLAFDGHNNEAGGAARIEGYKEFVRVRLTKETLTAYVIAIDEPATDGEKLAPRIVDTFTLTARPEKTG